MARTVADLAGGPALVDDEHVSLGLGLRAEVVSLPLHSGMPQAHVDRVCDAALLFFS